ncbi:MULTISPECIES: rhodanese-like domain-containing protein [Thioalkalivibrio]|uniref:rhodanese-like domain-containing protein n=1 Tax=Thioalkalivibrio TaxID=106633 RepID=UPI0003706252|nr:MULTISPECIES: rhodanese-like domain-containing protein [Thioalkalivibrio]OOC49180.1 rhodanese-like domain-containing protein [Thioalkalivibrio versutus]
MDHHDEEFLRRAQAARARINEIEPQQVDASLASGAVAIDVREPGEYQKGSLPSARNVALDSITRQIEGVAPDKDAPMVCFCNGGNRGALAAAQLVDLGYTNVQSIAGGLRAYQKANDTSKSSA